MITLMGGTFDPPHIGHVRSAAELMRYLNLDECRLMPCHTPPHKPPPAATPEQRLAMIRLAAAGTGLSVEDFEVRRGGLSYTADTIVALRRRIPPKTRLCLALGVDSFVSLRSWERYELILKNAHLLVIARPGFNARLPRANRRDPLSSVSGGILGVSLTPYDISSTRIRAQIGRGDASAALSLSAPVWNYIRAERLYL